MVSTIREKLPTLFGEEAPASRVEEGLRRAERIAWYLEESIELPLVRVRIGLDTLLGLVPAVGDFTSALVSLYPLLEGVHLGVPRSLVRRMLVNVAADFVLGAVPVLGDLFDLWFRANRRNVALLRAHFREREAKPAPARARRERRGADADVGR